MPSPNKLDIFAVVPPGLETFLRSELVEQGFTKPRITPGGVSFSGTWSDVWRANLCLRGAARILVRVGEFTALHLSQLDKKSRQLPWQDFLSSGAPVKVEASCRKSKIYHSGAAAERVTNAVAKVVGAISSAEHGIKVLVRIEANVCTVSVDTSGELLHRRGFKQSIGKAPLRESLAALLLRACVYSGQEPVLDPMCGSGTIPIEAAEIACGLHPGRERSFAFELLSSFEPENFINLKHKLGEGAAPPDLMFYGYDRNKGAIEACLANAQRSGVADAITFRQQVVSRLERPEGMAGLVLVNPPYGARIGDRSELRSLYQSLGRELMDKFEGWRIGLISSDDRLAKATGLPFVSSEVTFPHGALRVRLHRTEALGPV